MYSQEVRANSRRVGIWFTDGAVLPEHKSHTWSEHGAA